MRQRVALYPAPAGQETVTVYVLHSGHHADLAVPRLLVQAHGGPCAAAAALLPPSPWLGLGWGDARYFRGSGMNLVRALDALRALLRPGNPSAVRLEALAAAPPEALPGAVMMPLTLSRAGFDRLLERLERSFATPLAVIEQRPDRPRPQVYFEGRDTFHILHTCNHWIGGDLLGAAGLPSNGLLDLHAAGLMKDLQWRARGVRMQAPPGT